MNEDTKSVTILKALADDVRLGIAKHIASQDGLVSSSDIVGSCARRLELSQPAMSHHFKKLVDAGVLTVEKHGTENFYTLNKKLCSTHGINVQKL